MSWSFAIVNNRLAEIFFDKKKSGEISINGYCYVKKEEYKTKQERKWIDEDTKHIRVVFRNKKYKVTIDGVTTLC